MPGSAGEMISSRRQHWEKWAVPRDQANLDVAAVDPTTPAVTSGVCHHPPFPGHLHPSRILHIKEVVTWGNHAQISTQDQATNHGGREILSWPFALMSPASSHQRWWQEADTFDFDAKASNKDLWLSLFGIAFGSSTSADDCRDEGHRDRAHPDCSRDPRAWYARFFLAPLASSDLS